MAIAATVVPRTTLALFSLPAIMMAFMLVPAGALLQGIYGKFFGLSLTALGTGLLAAQVFRAAISPLIGHASDVVHRRTGSRKVFVVIGVLIAITGVWFLYQPPEGVGFWYFTGWLMFAFLGMAMKETPYRAWSIELSHDYAQRSRIAAWIAFAGFTGGLAFWLIPYGSQYLGYAEDASITPQTLVAAALITVVITPILVLAAVAKVPNGDGQFEREGLKDSLSEIATSLIKNGPLVRLIVLYMAVGCGAGTAGGIMFFFIDGYLQLGDKFALLSVLAMPMPLLAIPFWGWACMRFEKHKVMAVGMGLGGLFYIAQGLLTPGDGAFLALLFLYSGTTFFFISLGVAFPSMLGDIVDYGTWRFGHERAGMYYAMFGMMVGMVGAVGTAVGLWLVDFAGFDPTATTQTADGVMGIKLAYAVVPGISFALVAPFLWFHPITRRRHTAILYAIRKRSLAA